MNSQLCLTFRLTGFIFAFDQFLDLTSGIRSDQLDGFFPPAADEENVIYDGPPRTETLILNDVDITLRGIAAICQCKELKSLHLAKTKITRKSFRAKKYVLVVGTKYVFANISFPIR